MRIPSSSSICYAVCMRSHHGGGDAVVDVEVGEHLRVQQHHGGEGGTHQQEAADLISVKRPYSACMRVICIWTECYIQ